MGGIGGATQYTPSEESSWTIEGDRLIIPIKNSSTSSVAGKYILRLMISNIKVENLVLNTI